MFFSLSGNSVKKSYAVPENILISPIRSTNSKGEEGGAKSPIL